MNSNTSPTRDRYRAFLGRTSANILLYFVLLSVAVLTVFPFVWVLLNKEGTSTRSL